MENKIAFEIEWRELLVRRLNNAQAALRKDRAAEEANRLEARRFVCEYDTYADAHEAYGWGYITEPQLESIKAVFENRDMVPTNALRRLSDFIGSIKGEIMMLKRDPDYREEFKE